MSSWGTSWLRSWLDSWGPIAAAPVVEVQVVGSVIVKRPRIEYLITGVGNIASEEQFGRPTVWLDQDELALLLLAA